MRYIKLLSIVLLVVLNLSVPQNEVKCEEYLSGGDLASIGAGSAGMAFLGSRALRLDSTRSPLIKGPLPLERKIQLLLGGKCYAGKTNFLDNSFGSAVTPAVTGVLLLATDLAWPQGDRSKTALQDQYLYLTGLLATEGVTSLFKGVVARERPLVCLHPDLAAERGKADYAYDRQSFFSGHTSSAFFAATFANLRFRSIMRSELTLSEYRDWRWAPPFLLYGWASFVGWSRIHAYKHYLSDVIAGALAGYLVAELFHSFGDDIYGESDTGDFTPVVKLTFRF